MTRTVKQIIDAAGGPKKIAEAASHTRWKITAKSVYDWPDIGIPDRHWPILIRLARSSAEELYRANKIARTRARPKRSPARALATA